MKIYSSGNSDNSSLFGDFKKDKSEQNKIANVDWVNFFEKKAKVVEEGVLPHHNTLEARKAPGGDYGTGSVLGMSRLHGSEEMKSVLAKDNRLAIKEEKEGIKNIKKSLDKDYRVAKVEEDLVPKLNTLSKCSSSMAGSLVNPNNSVSIFDSDPFSHIKNRVKEKKEIIKESSSKKTTVKSNDLLGKVFDSLTNKSKDTKHSDNVSKKSIFDNL